MEGEAESKTGAGLGHDGPAPPYRPPADGPRVVHADEYEILPHGGAAGRGAAARGGFVVVDKPAGLLAVPGIGPDKQDSARSRVLALFPWATGPMTVHRLDMDTSGLLVVALDAWTHARLSVDFERRRVEKRYTALVEGHLPGRAGFIELPLRKDTDRRVHQLVDFRDGRPARTEWRRVAHERLGGAPVTRVEMRPVSGRTHQLRVHAAHPVVRVVGAPAEGLASLLACGLGAPIVGDDLYGGREAERLMLHAAVLELPHPLTRRRFGVRSPAGF